MNNISQLTSQNNKNKIDFIKKYLNKSVHYGYGKYKIIESPKEAIKIEANDFNKYNINMINTKQKMIKKRKASIDLLRIIAMIEIVISHILYQGKGLNKYQRYSNKIKILFTYIFWHVNSYSIISGIVGYKSTKYSNLLYLWLYVVFYSVSIHYYYLLYKHDVSIEDELYVEFYPIIYKRYWYFTSYFGMYIFLPAINKGVQHLNKPEFKLLVMSILGIFVFWQTYINKKDDVFNMYLFISLFSIKINKINVQ